MKTHDVIQHFGTQAACARVLGMSKGAISQWGEQVPLATAARLEKLTNGVLKLDITQYPIRKRAAS